MKKFPSILFVFSLLFMLTACSSSAAPSQESSGQTTSPSSQQDSVSVSNAVLESESTESEQSANNTLIVYFSRWGNTEYLSDVDAITSASIVVDNNSRYGTTEYVANMIAENVGGDLHRIETVTPYTADFDELRDVNHDEMSRNYLPELKESNLDISAYDTVFIGYPVWATDVPQAVLSFLKEYDLSGKTVIPFCTHDGYGAGNSYQTIAEASHAAVLLEGIAIEAKDVPNAQVYIVPTPDEFPAAVKWASQQNVPFGVMAVDTVLGQLSDVRFKDQFSLGDSVVTASQHLFEGLRYFDLNPEVKIILVQGFAKEGVGLAYMNRLEKSAGQQYFTSK